MQMGGARSQRGRPPGPRGHPIRHARALVLDPLNFLLDVAREHGDVAFVPAGPFDLYLLSHPDLVRELLAVSSHEVTKSRVLREARRVLGDGLLTSEGDLHRGHRRLIQPLFHQERVAAYGDAIARRANETRDRIRPDEPFDLHATMNALTLTIVGETLFGSEVGAEEARRVDRALREALDMYGFYLLPGSRLLDHLPLPNVRRFHRAVDALDETVFGVIERHLGSAGPDLVSLLLAARHDEQPDRGLSDREVRDEAMTLFLAGHETTSNALSWAWYLLSQSPEAEGRLEAEVDEVLGGRPATMADLPALPWTRMVLTEAMRLYPPSWGMSRRAAVDLELGGWTIPAGAEAMVSQWVIHHDQRWYPDPFRFDPERWTPESAATRPRLAYYPFGAGPRICIGEDFAWAEATIVLATLAARWRFRLVPGHPIVPEPLITLRPKYGIRVIAEERRPGAA
jgi:cytochrome P450